MKIDSYTIGMLKLSSVLLLLFLSFSLFSAEVEFKDESAWDLKIDAQNRLCVGFKTKVVRYSLSGQLDKEYKLTKGDSLINFFLMPGNDLLLITKKNKKLIRLNDSLLLVDSIDTKKIAGFYPQQLISVQKEEFVILELDRKSLKTYHFDFSWKTDIKFDLSSFKDGDWMFVNGFGGAYRYFYSRSQGGIIRTENNGIMMGFMPLGSQLHSFYTHLANMQEKVFAYSGGSFVEASFDNLNDYRIKATVPTDGELTAYLINEVVVKLYKNKISIFNTQPNY